MRRAASIPFFLLPGANVSAARDSEQRVSSDYSMTARLESRLRLTECNNPAGPLVVLRAVLVLSGLEARVNFRSAPGAERGDEQAAARVPLVPPGERVVRAPHWARGAPGRCRLSVALVDRDAEPLAPEFEVGECVDGITNLDIPFAMNVSAVAWVAARDWSEQRGPLIRLSGEMVSTRGVTVRLGFRPSEQQTGGTGEGVTEFPLVRPGMAFYSREKTLEAGSSGNPWVSVQFVAEGGQSIGGEQLVGRCVRAS